MPGLWCVVKGNGVYCIGPVNNVPSDHIVYAPDSDYSCYVTIKNKSKRQANHILGRARSVC